MKCYNFKALERDIDMCMQNGFLRYRIYTSDFMQEYDLRLQFSFLPCSKRVLNRAEEKWSNLRHRIHQELEQMLRDREQFLPIYLKMKDELEYYGAEFSEKEENVLVVFNGQWISRYNISQKEKTFKWNATDVGEYIRMIIDERHARENLSKLVQDEIDAEVGLKTYQEYLAERTQ